MAKISIHPAVDNGVQPGSGELRGRYPSLQMREQSRRGKHHGAVRS